MKKSLLVLALSSSVSFIAQQQLNNGNLESWTQESYGEEPSQWLDPINVGFGTLNYVVGFGEGDPLTSTKISGVQAQGGSGNSILLETKNAVGNTLISNGFPKIYGYLWRLEPFTGSAPISVSVDVKSQIQNGDTAYVKVEFRDANDNVLKYAYQAWYGNINTWQNVTLPVLGNVPGTITKIFVECQSSYSTNGTEVVGSKLYLDNFSLNYPCQTNEEVFLSNMAFFSLSNATSQMGVSNYDLPNSLTPNTNNPRNFLDIGKPIRFKIKCTNQKQNGQSIVSGQCRISTDDPNIILIDSLSGLNNVGWNNEGWSTDEFEIYVSNSVTNSYTAYVDFIVVENGIEYITPCVPIPVKPFSIASYTIDDDNNPDSQGDGDQIVEPNETIEMLPLINNTSEFDASLVKGYFLNLDNYSGINIWNNTQGASGTVYNYSVWNYAFGQPQPILAGATNASPQFDFVFDYNLNAVYAFDLYLATHGGVFLFGNNIDKTLIRTSNKISFNVGNPQAPLSGSSTQNVNANQFELYPNPAQNEINIIGEVSIDNSYLSSLDGKRVYLENSGNKILIPNLTNGIYTLCIETNNGETLVKKVAIYK
jgi:hypothetical protein